MLKIDLKYISEYLIRNGRGPDQITREFFDGWVRYSYFKEHRLYFEIYDHKVSYDYFNYRFSGFDRYFNIVGEDDSFETDLVELVGNIKRWLDEIDNYEIEQAAIDPWDEYLFTPPKELTSGIETIDFDSQEPFTEEEQRLIEADLDKTKEFIRNEVGLDEDRLAVIERDIAEIKQELSKQSKFSWKRLAREKLIEELINVAKDRWSMVQLYKLFEFLGPFDLPQVGN